MSKYTTGEMAKLAGIFMYTVQYYDNRSVLSLSKLSEGERCRYTEEDLRRLKVICFLRGANLPINAIAQLLAEKNPENVISILLQQQEALRKELRHIHAVMLAMSIPLDLIEIAALLLWIFRENICPKCHEIFRPKFREAFWTNHTPRTRRLTCPHCCHKGFCVKTRPESVPS